MSKNKTDKYEKKFYEQLSDQNNILYKLLYEIEKSKKKRFLKIFKKRH